MTSSRLVRPLAAVGNALLWVTAVLGTLSILLAVATVVAGVQPLIFRSSSMSPQIDAGALALSRSVDASDVRIGDVVSVESSKGVRVTHRVVSIDDAPGDGRRLQLQGDTNAQPDEEDYVVSEVDRVFLDVPYLGRVASWAMSPWAMFLAGVVLTLVIVSFWVRPGTRGAASGGAAAVAAIGLAAASLAPPPMTEAYFTDSSTFDAGTIQAHQVRIFDWNGDTPCVTNADGSVTLRSRLASPRYRQIWFFAPVGGARPATPFLRVSPSGEAGAAVETRLTRSQILNGQTVANGTYELVGRSELKGVATTPWLSNGERTTQVTIDGTAVRCGSVNLPPSIVFRSPENLVTYVSREAIEGLNLVQCGRYAPCGTATDQDGIYRIEYKLQRANWLGTQCWAPEALITGYYRGSCDQWREPDTSPQVPTTSGSTVTWRIPLGSNGPGTTYNQTGEYTLYLRVWDNTAARALSERTIRFTVK